MTRRMIQNPGFLYFVSEYFETAQHKGSRSRAAAGSGCAFKCVVKLSACRHQARRTAGFQRRSLSRGSLKRWDGHSKVPYAHVHHASPLRPFNELSCSETGDGCQSVCDSAYVNHLVHPTRIGLEGAHLTHIDFFLHACEYRSITTRYLRSPSYADL